MRNILILLFALYPALALSQVEIRHFPAETPWKPICNRIEVVDITMESHGYEFVEAVGDYRKFRHENGNEAVMKREDTPWQVMECLIIVGDPDWYRQS